MPAWLRIFYIAGRLNRGRMMENPPPGYAAIGGGIQTLKGGWIIVPNPMNPSNVAGLEGGGGLLAGCLGGASSQLPVRYFRNFLDAGLIGLALTIGHFKLCRMPA